MPKKTSIGWTDYSTNPIRFRRKDDGKKGWHCEKISTGCANCYSEAIDGRFGMQLGFTKANSNLVEPYIDDKELAELIKLNRKGPAMVFVGDMTDLFLDMIPKAYLDQLFGTITYCRNLTFQVLTKRPERARRYFLRKNHWGAAAAYRDLVYGPEADIGDGLADWPPKNVWLGVSAENQETADERIPILLSIPAALRFVSFEPLLSDIVLDRIGAKAQWEGMSRSAIRREWPKLQDMTGIDWAIVGGESGPKRRPMELAWLESIADQCEAANVPLFVKQDAALRDGQQGRIPDRLWSFKQYPTPSLIGV